MSDKMIRLMKMVIAIQANPGISAQERADKCEASELMHHPEYKFPNI
ncbi:hypothetical protein M3650_13400 [Paenibacillus sp. MER TA 81-3]|nr:hypothetical protein [Paenibacillus sp. MER TA 81-3]MCM3339591.1 hypothetical protein [Paenibacillus sp. MER TA 81-3]